MNFELVIMPTLTLREFQMTPLRQAFDPNFRRVMKRVSLAGSRPF